MREILFRAKTVKGGQWIQGDLYRSGTKPSDGEFTIAYWDDEDGWMTENVQPGTIGQFVGLKDKNGKEIYEGDIIRFVNGQKKVNGEWVDDEFIYTVEYSGGAFRGVSGLSKALYAVEVIGNIYDDPQLINMKRLG